MEVKKPTIKSIPYEDFKDNEYLENMVKQLNERRYQSIGGLFG
jgi:NADH dehydrogenase subunit B (EC 1.6.5.3)